MVVADAVVGVAFLLGCLSTLLPGDDEVAHRVRHVVVGHEQGVGAADHQLLLVDHVGDGQGVGADDLASRVVDEIDLRVLELLFDHLVKQSLHLLQVDVVPESHLDDAQDELFPLSNQ